MEERRKNMKQRKHRCLSLLLALTLMLGLLPGTAWAAEGALQGSGTAGEPYLIADAADLKAFRDLVAGGAADDGENPNAGLCAKLTADIDLREEPWEPFAPADGHASSAYAGTFDGDGHTIRGLSIDSSASNQGLFGWINGATIKNLQVEGSVVSSGNYVGGIVGKAQSGTIENCSFTGTVSCTKNGGYAGGITGYAGNTKTQTATIAGCFHAGSVTSSGYAGGIVGYAKYTAISDCYHTGEISGASRAGGIAAQLQNNCSAANSYNIGAVTGSSTAADICDFLYTSASLTNCYYQHTATGAGTGSVTNCAQISGADGLAEKLGSAFAADSGNINGGWPILAWQAGTGPVQQEPAIEITGSAVLYDTNSGDKPTSTLTVAYKNMEEEPAVTWELISGEGVVALRQVQNPGASDNVRIVQALQPGKATVRATAGDCSDEIELTVMPFVTTVEIAGTVAAGQTVWAQINTLGGEEYDYEQFPEVQVQWYYLKQEDYLNYDKLIPLESSARTLVVPENLAGDYLYFKCIYNGEEKTPPRPIQIAEKADGILSADRDALTLPEELRADNTKLTLPERGKNGSAITWESSNPLVISADGTVTLPDEGKETVTLTATLSYGGKTETKAFSVVVWSQAAVDADRQSVLQQAAASLGEWYKLYPVYGEDINLNEMLQSDLKAEGFDGIEISVQSVVEEYGGAGIAENGDVTYFYTDPNAAPAIHFGRCQVTFLLEKDGAKLSFGPVPVLLYWDAEKVETAMKQEILNQVTLESILAEGDTASSVTGNLTLPRAVDGKTWTLISWESSNEDVISISSEKQSSADALFAPYIGVVKPGETAQKVTLTAAFTFQLTNDVGGNERPIVLYQSYEVTVPAMTEEDADTIRAALMEKLDAGFAAKGLTDAVTGEQLQRNADGSYTAINDIQLPTTRDFGVDGKYDPVTLSSDCADVITAPDVNNAARFWVYRPGVGQEAASATITVTLHDRDTSITASKEFKICVPALTQEEIDAELALMEKVKANYFNGLNNGANAAKDDVRYDLTPFVEVYEGESGQLVWVRDAKDMKGSGIVPTPIEGWEELEAWRLFRSSNPGVIAHETLEVTRQSEAKAVTITSYLSSETLGRYGELYQSDPVKYAQYEALQDLYYQPVTAETASQSSVLTRAAAAAKNGSAVSENDTATVLVRGTKNPASTIPVVETIDVTFTLVGPEGTWIAPVTLTGLDEQKTVYDVFQQVLSENGYTYTRERGTYIVSITKPNGDILAEEDMGENSGWLYRVNGTIPDVYMAACGLHDGDTIQVFYTEDYEKENGYENDDWSSSTQPGREEENGAEVVWNSGRGVYEITLPKNSRGPQRVTLSAEPGQIVVIVYADGTEKVLKKSALEDGKVRFLLEEDASVRLVTYTNSFADVAQDAWYADAVDFVAGRELLRGVAADRFAPNTTLSRGMLATVLCRLEGAEGETRQSDFSDVGADAWYAQAVAWAAAEEIVVGYADGSFRPDAPITREQLAVMLYRYAKTQGMRTGGRDTLRSFSDSGSVSDWARDAVAWTVDSGILAGRPEGTLDPAGTASRAEAAAMLQRLVGLMVR